MTQKYLNMLAQALATSRPPTNNLEKMDQWLEDVKWIANACQATNPKFDQVRFTTACKTWGRI